MKKLKIKNGKVIIVGAICALFAGLWAYAQQPVTVSGTASTNVAQFGGNNVATGTGTGGNGIPRVTVSSDSSLAANQSVNINQIAGQTPVTATGRPLDADRGLVVRSPIACTSFINIDQTADATVITGVSGQRIYVCSIAIIAQAAETISIWEGTGTACGTSSVAIYGSTTESQGMSLTANGGFTQAAGVPFFRTSVDTNNLCLRQSGSARLSGMISYVIAAND